MRRPARVFRCNCARSECWTKTLASLPWIKLVDDALEPDDREKSGAESCQAGQEENAKREQGLPPRRLWQSARQASLARSSSARRAGAAVAVRRSRAPGIGGRFVLAVGGCVVLRHFCARCRLTVPGRPSCHAPVSPLHSARPCKLP